MATEKQIAANRANARLSTGPRTIAGKQRASRNAYRHGLCTPLPAGPLNAARTDTLKPFSPNTIPATTPAQPMPAQRGNSRRPSSNCCGSAASKPRCCPPQTSPRRKRCTGFLPSTGTKPWRSGDDDARFGTSEARGNGSGSGLSLTGLAVTFRTDGPKHTGR